MSWAAVGGAAIGAVGSIVSSKNASNAGQVENYSPVNITTEAGTTAFDPKFNVLEARAAEGQREARAMLEAQLLGQLRGQNFNFGVANATLGQLDPSSIGQAYGGLDSALLNGATLDASRTAQTRFDQLGVQQNSLGTLGLAQGFNAGNAGRVSDFAFNVGADLLFNQDQPQSFNGIAAERLTALRSAARPAEERAVDSKFNSLFSQGRLGTTGGARGIGELALQQELADQNRIINSQDFANSQQNQERAFFQQQQQLGSNLFGTALTGIGQDQNVALQQGQLGAQLFGQQGNSLLGALDSAQTGTNDQISRAGARIDGAQNLFQFGNAIKQNELDSALQRLGATQTIDQGVLDVARLSSSVGSQQATANANAAQIRAANASSPLGGALQGVGAALGAFGTARTARDNPTPTPIPAASGGG